MCRNKLITKIVYDGSNNVIINRFISESNLRLNGISSKNVIKIELFPDYFGYQQYLNKIGIRQECGHLFFFHKYYNTEFMYSKEEFYEMNMKYKLVIYYEDDRVITYSEAVSKNCGD